ncbi:MAG TPA: Gfo/Idh/MocA family oxidoreductase [Bryobacteraceae bacterium]|nr:Gfo/Idh/MocA family oxidoreductase [Bryobacteraceae bacterium]
MIRTLPGIVLLLGAVAFGADLRLGIIGTDTSHVIEFTKMLNDSASPDHVAGARVVAAFKGGSTAMPESYRRVDKFADELRSRWQVEFVPDIGALCGRVDGIMLESVDGQQHLAQVKEAVKCGKPMWIDKPLASTLADAREIARIARDAHVPWFSASSLRFSDIAAAVKSEDNTGAIAWGPGSLGSSGLDLAWYAIHTVELLYAILGPGCEEVTRVHTDASDVIVGRWRGGRIGEVRAMRPGDGYGALAFRAKGVAASPPNAEDAYRPLVVRIVRFFETGRPPVSNEETLETMEFMDAAQRSMASDGAPVKLP